MELGEKLRHARKEAGLSQRQLCGDFITRNMLSQIEHGTARPSVDTLRYLAGRLEKPVSFFLEEHPAVSANQDLMHRARESYISGQFREAWLLLQKFRQPDPVLEGMWRALTEMTVLEMARQAVAEEKHLYARQILGEMEPGFRTPGLEKQRLLLLGRLPGADLEELVNRLPSLDQELMFRAKAALTRGDPVRAGQLLLAAEDQKDPEWHLLWGQGLLMQGQYRQAADHLEKAEAVFSSICWPLLEICFRELGDFQKAYFYACQQR